MKSIALKTNEPLIRVVADHIHYRHSNRQLNETCCSAHYSWIRTPSFSAERGVVEFSNVI